MMKKILISSLAVALLVSFAWAQQGEFAEEAVVVVVEVPVQVLVDGKPVRNLTAQDFEVRDEGKRQEIVGFDAIDLSRVEASVPELPVGARRHFLLLFDLSFSDPTAIVRAREAAQRLLREGLHPADLVAVATFSLRGGARFVLGFTSDRRQAELAIESLGVPQLAEEIASGANDPLQLAIADVEEITSLDTSRGGGLSGVNSDQILLKSLQDQSLLADRANRQVQQGQITKVASSLEPLARLMGRVHGRKHVVYLSEGFETPTVFGTMEMERTDEITRDSMSGEFWKIDSEERFGSSAVQSSLRDLMEEFRRADCTVQAVDIGGLRTGVSADDRPRGSGQDALFYFANETGGELYRNTNDLAGAMRDMLQRTSVTYVLAIQPRNLELDGGFHRLKVRLKKSVRGARILHRPGYYEPRRGAGDDAAVQRLVTAGMVLGGADGGAIDAAVLAAPFAVGRDKAYVPVLVEIDGTSLLAGKSAGELPTELYAYALGSDGRIADFFAQFLELDVAKVGEALRASGFKFWGELDLPAGDYVVRAVVRNSESGVAGVRSFPLHVPAVDEGEAALLPPLFPEPGGKWLQGSKSDAQQRGIPYPFLLRQQPFMPAARPVVAAGGEAQLSLVGYNLGEGPFELEVRLLTPEGKPVPGGKIELVDQLQGSASGPDSLLAIYRPGTPPPGTYRLEVTVAVPDGVNQTSSIPVVISG